MTQQSTCRYLPYIFEISMSKKCSGNVAQLVERLPSIHEVMGFILSIS